jgi:hypothetical protein
MIRSILRWLRQQSRRIHVRVILFAVLNMAALAVAALIGPLIPDDMGDLIGAEAVDTILQVIATSMLAVVTFSLTIMVTAFSRAEGQWTPRSHILLREDTRTHSVLATFLGAYLYALIAIILRAADVFGENEMVVLFFTTLLVVAAIVISIIRWILHLEGYGSLTVTARQMEAPGRRCGARGGAFPRTGRAAADGGGEGARRRHRYPGRNRGIRAAGIRRRPAGGGRGAGCPHPRPGAGGPLRHARRCAGAGVGRQGTRQGRHYAPRGGDPRGGYP